MKMNTKFLLSNNPNLVRLIDLDGHCTQSGSYRNGVHCLSLISLTCQLVTLPVTSCLLYLFLYSTGVKPVIFLKTSRKVLVSV